MWREFTGLSFCFRNIFWRKKTSHDFPPAITHPEFFYGFIGVALAFQIVFLIIAWDPAKYRLMMLPAMVEKFSFAIAVYTLFALGRVAPTMVALSTIDLTLGLLFIVSFLKTKQE